MFKSFIHACNSHAWITTAIICTVCLSCSDDIKVVTEFPIDEQLTGKHIEQLDTMYTAYSVTKLSDRYIFGIKKDKELFCIYDDSLKFLYKTMRHGKGHGEWQAPVPTGQMINLPDKSYACFVERESCVLYAVDIDAPTSSPIKIKDFGKTELYGTNIIYQMDDNQYIGTRLQEQCELFTYDAETQRLTFFQPDAMPSKLFAVNPFNLSQTLTAYNDESKILAVSYFYFPRISVVSANGQQDKTLQIGKQQPHYTAMTEEDPHFYCVDMCSTNSKIYVLFDEPEMPDEMCILVFDWDANPIARYHVPRLTCFTVDENNNRFIAQAEDDTHGAWFELRIP